MQPVRRKLLLLPAAVLLGSVRCGFAQTQEAADHEAVNVVRITPNLVTSGQPLAAALATLGALGFQSVINLALTTSRDAVADEGDILKRQGIEYVHQPIDMENPTERDFETFAATLTGMRERNRKVLVHCAINLRASSFVFLYRTTVLKEPAEASYESVAKVWSPRAPWKALMVAQLRKHQIAFDPY